MLWWRDTFECFESRDDSFDELFDDDELLLLDDDLLLVLPLKLLLSFVLTLLFALPPSTPDEFNVSELKLLEELLEFRVSDWFAFDGCGCIVDNFDEYEVVRCVDGEETAVPLQLADEDVLRCADLCDPFWDDCFESNTLCGNAADDDDDDDAAADGC